MAFTYPDGVQDHPGILTYAKDARQANRAFWDAIELQAQENILMFIGGQCQWWTHFPALRTWRPLTHKKGAPRKPVTNRVKPLVNDLASKLVAFKPPITWSPGSTQDADYVAASVADRVNQAIEKETDIQSYKAVGARWLGTTGNLIVIASYDTSFASGSTIIKAHRCQHCGTDSMPKEIEDARGACPECGSQEAILPEPSIGPDGMPVGVGAQTVTNPRFEPAIGEDGVPLGLEYPRGRHMLELENVFTCRFDIHCIRFQQSPWFWTGRTRDRAWIVERYGEDFASKVTWSSMADGLSQIYATLATATFSTGGPTGSSLGEGDRALVERLWIAPNREKAPEGIYAVIVGGKVAESTGYPYHDERGDPMRNITLIEFDQVPGRALASTRLDDVIPLQRELNELDLFIKMHHRRMANSVWTAPRGSRLSRVSGENGIMIEYDALSTGHRPQREPGLSAPGDLYQYREIRKREIDEVFGSYEVGRGQAPKGVDAYSALALLDENAQKGQTNVFANWALGWAEVARQQLNIWREYADEERTVSLGVGRWATQKFNKAKMIGGVDITVDIGQGRPMTRVARDAAIGSAISEGILNVFDPQIRFLVLRAKGIPELMPDYNDDYVGAGRVVDQIMSARSPQELPQSSLSQEDAVLLGLPGQLPALPFEHHGIYLSVIAKAIKDEGFSQLQDFQKNALIMLAQYHYQTMRTDMLEQASRAGQNAPRLGPKPGGGGSDNAETNQPADTTTQGGVLTRETQGASADVNQGATMGQP